MERTWIGVGQSPSVLFGSTCCILDKTVYVIGGNDKNDDTQSIIRVSTFDSHLLQWKNQIINGNCAVNRSFHASTVYGAKIFTFGGSTSLGSISEVMEVTASAEEVTCKTVAVNGMGLRGLSASTVGISSKAEKIIIFGGINDRLEYQSESQIYDPTDLLENGKMTPLQIDSELPPARAFHSAAVSGEHKQYLIIHGGRGKTGLLSDTWVLDSTSLFMAPSETPQIDPKAKSGKGGKGNTAPILPFWCQISTNIPFVPRCLHSSFVTSTARSLTLSIFGGVSDSGILSLDLCQMEILQEAPNKFTGNLISSGGQQPEMDSKRHSFCSCEILDDGSIVAILVFGGSQYRPNDSFALPQLMILNESCTYFSNTAVFRQINSARQDLVDDIIGHIDYPNGDIYDGEILKEDDVTYRHGRGKLLSVDGSVYEGNWCKDIRHGIGCYKTNDESEVYTGQFHSGEYSGEGKLRQIQSEDNRGTIHRRITEYEGLFESSLFQGQGILKDSYSNTTYQGEFMAGLRHGRGILTRTSDNAVLYDGDWRDDIPCGYGTFMLEGGHIYTGYMQNGLPNGEGHCRYTDGSEYTGSWKSGKRNGFGSFVGAHLDEYNGKWVGDQRSGKGTWKSARGDIYEGVWDNDLPHGHGQVTYNLGDNCNDPTRELKYDGQWDHGRRSGRGEITYANGVRKKGSWNATTKDIAFNEEV